jgi:hypothetical protein
LAKLIFSIKWQQRGIKMANNYGDTAVLATKNYKNSPIDAWETAVAQTHDSKSARDKSCPRNTYLALCETGEILGIPKGVYCSSRVKENKDYALKALELLKKTPKLSGDKNTLWDKATAR